MGLGLATKAYNPYGAGTVYDSDLLASGKWQYAIYDKTPLSQAQTKQVFDYYQSHSYFKNARYAQGLQGKHTWIGVKPGTTVSPFAGGSTKNYSIGFNSATLGARQGDPFKALRVGGDFFKDKLDITRESNKISFYNQAKKTQYYNPLPGGAGKWSDTNPLDKHKNFPYGVPGSPNINYRTREVGTGKREGEKQTGYILGGAYVAEDVYNQMTPTERLFYGKTLGQARRLDPGLQTASDVVEAAYQYRRSRAKKKTGLSAAVGSIAKIALPAAAATFLGPVGASLASGANTLFQGGDLKSALLSGAQSFLGAKSPISSIWSKGGAAISNAGPVQLTNNIFNPGGTGKMGFSLGGFLGDIADVGKDIFSSVQNIFSGSIGGTSFLDLVGTGLELYSQNKAYSKARDASKQASRTADPKAPARGLAGRQLEQLLADPSQARRLPGFQEALSRGERAVIRRNAAGGHSRGTKMASDLFEYGANFEYRNFSNYAELLSNISGGSPRDSAGYQAGTGIISGEGLLDKYSTLGSAGRRVFGTTPQSSTSTVFNPAAGNYGGWNIEDILSRGGNF